MEVGDDLLGRVKILENRFHGEISQVANDQELLRLKACYLGKQGHLAEVLRGLGQMPSEQRPLLGQEANRLKQVIDHSCRDTLKRFEDEKKQKKLAQGVVDLTLPGRSAVLGSAHPLRQTMEEVEDIFLHLGFSIFEGPDVEQDYYNFAALNISANHPARDMQDTFYIDGDFLGGHVGPPLLRTHTSPVQIHVMESHKPPIRMIAPGAVYRRDSDITHTPMFHQVEGLVVDQEVRFSDLQGIVALFLRKFFGKRGVRFRPSYFPFTEPSAEVDLACAACEGKKDKSACRLCSGTGWLEVMGCGMVHPNVLRHVKYNPEKLTGFAFGMGIERMAMLRLGIPDIRLFYENDLRFLRQF